MENEEKKEWREWLSIFVLIIFMSIGVFYVIFSSLDWLIDRDWGGDDEIEFIAEDITRVDLVILAEQVEKKINANERKINALLERLGHCYIDGKYEITNNGYSTIIEYKTGQILTIPEAKAKYLEGFEEKCKEGYCPID